MWKPFQVMFILEFCKNTLIWTVFETKINSSGDHMKKWSIIFLWFELKTVRFLLQMSSLVWLKSEKVVKWRKNLIFIRIIPHLFSFQNWENLHFTENMKKWSFLFKMKNLLGETRLNSKTSFGFENGQKCHFDPKMVIRKNNECKLMMKFSKIRLAGFLKILWLQS